jgi:teichuronic acid biosynthesis glycosyltransferase TuaC
VKIKVILASVHYPNNYCLWTPWNKIANLAISEYVDTEVIAPLPFAPPFKPLPFHEFNNIPIIENMMEGTVHHPRFLYILPKKIFYRFIGNLYEIYVSNYILNNIKKQDIIHAHQIYPDGYGMIKTCRVWSIPLIVELHSTGSLNTWMNSSKIKDKIMETLNFSTKIICISHQLCDLLREIGIDDNKIQYVPLGVDINKFKPTNNKKLKKELNLSENRVILFVGRLVKLKGLNTLLKAISILPKKEGFKVLIVGDGPEKNSLIGLSKKLGLEHVLTFCGEVRGNKLLKLYSLADLFILPSLTEGRPVVIYEAMANECAIIASNVGGIPEQVKDNFNGFLIEPEDPEILSYKINYLLNNPKLMEKMGKNGRKRIIEKDWTVEGYAKRVFELYNEII